MQSSTKLWIIIKGIFAPSSVHSKKLKEMQAFSYPASHTLNCLCISNVHTWRVDGWYFLYRVCLFENLTKRVLFCYGSDKKIWFRLHCSCRTHRFPFFDCLMRLANGIETKQEFQTHIFCHHHHRPSDTLSCTLLNIYIRFFMKSIRRRIMQSFRRTHNISNISKGCVWHIIWVSQCKTRSRAIYIYISHWTTNYWVKGYACRLYGCLCMCV